VALVAGTRIGPYEVVSRIGAGGMGEVYRARDTTLQRDAALKLLPDGSASDAERTGRFTREAQTLAALNHPHIAQVFGVERHDGSAVIAMELVEGEEVAARIARGPLPVEEATAIAIQIAEALEAAHELSIVHRDLKPANIRIRPDGTVKVLDFGLAKTVQAGSSPAALDHLTTLQSPAVTEVGVVLGTAAYMAPEQARGRMVDKRADIWAFGVVLFEMLTGRRMFSGETVTETIAAVMKDPIPFDRLPATTPPALRHLLARCLERDPRVRLRDIGEARIALGRVDTPHDVRLPAAPSRGRVLRLALGALGIAAAAGMAGWIVKPGAPGTPIRRFDLPQTIAETSSAEFAPDGSRIAYIKAGRLYVHTLASGVAADLGAVPPTARDLFWSHDSQAIGFAAESTIRTIPVTGGTPLVVCKIPASGRILAGLWLPDNTIVFAVWRESVYRVPATGGAPAVHVALDPATEVDAHSLTMAPGNRLLLSVHLRGEVDQQRIDIVEDGRRRTLSSDGDVWVPQFVPPNQLLFVRQQMNPGVWVVPFDGAALDLTKASMVQPGAAGFAAASDGTVLVMFMPKRRQDLVWVARSGTTTAVPGQAFEMSFGAFGLAPDGTRALISRVGPDFKTEIVVRDLATGTDTRVPPPRSVSSMVSGASASWAPDGRLFYGVGGVETSEIYDWPADGSTGGRKLVAGISAQMVAGRPDIYLTRDERGAYRLRRATLRPDGAVEGLEPVFPGNPEPAVRWFDVSQDGRMLAYTVASDDTQQANVFVATLPDLRERRQVTSNGGVRPKFSRDGKELFYFSGTRAGGSTRGELNVVSLSTNPLTIGRPSVVLVEDQARGLSFSSFDVAADGRLLMTRAADPLPGDEARLLLIQNWLAAIRK
jgi:serine/threonine-protein kinase